MRLMHGVGIVVTQLVDDFSNLVILVVCTSVADEAFESEADERVSRMMRSGHTQGHPASVCRIAYQLASVGLTDPWWRYGDH